MNHLVLRVWFGSIILGLAVAGACAPAPSPTAAPPKPAATAAATSPPAAKPAASPTAAPAASPAAKAAEKPVTKPAFDERAMAEFYQGKVVKIIVSSAPGGGFDTYARVLARHIGRQIPGGPNVIVENMPGAGSLIAANHIYNVAPKDGTVIGHVNGGIVLQQIFGAQGVQFDAAKFGYLGLPIANSMTCLAHSRTGVKSFEDTIGPNAKSLILGSNQTGDLNYSAPAVFVQAVNANIKIIAGYECTAKTAVAVEQGEVDGYCLGWESLKTGPAFDKVKTGEINILGVFSEKRPADMPASVPLAIDMAKTEEARNLIRYGSIIPNVYLRMFIAPPDLPPDRLALLQTAFMKTLQDKDFLEDAAKTKVDIDPLDGNALKELVVEHLRMPADIKAKLKPILAL